MIFQINYLTDQYDKYYANNSHFNIKEYTLFGNDEIEYFLKHYKYYDQFYSLNIPSSLNHIKNALMCDALRLMILYELGGVYLDSDIQFKDAIISLEQDLVGNVITQSRSLYFIKGIRRGDFIRMLLDKYLLPKPLTYDIKMIKPIDIIRPDVNVIQTHVLDKYFIHDKITTKG